MVKPLLQLRLEIIHTKNSMYSMLTIYDLIIGHDVLNKKNSPELTFYVLKEPFSLQCGCRFRFSSISMPVNPDYKLITLKSRRYSEEDKNFVEEETNKFWFRTLLITKNDLFQFQFRLKLKARQISRHRFWFQPTLKNNYLFHTICDKRSAFAGVYFVLL